MSFTVNQFHSWVYFSQTCPRTARTDPALDDMSRFARFTFIGDTVPFLSCVPATVQVPGSVVPAASSDKIARIHITQLTPEAFYEEYRSLSKPVIIQGALGCAINGPHSIDWSITAFAGTFGPDAVYQCRVHGDRAFAMSPSRWKGRSHARRVVATTPAAFAASIASGVASHEDWYIQADIRSSRAGSTVAQALDLLGDTAGLEVDPQYGPLVNMWWGAAGHTEPLHMDVMDGTLCQLRGRKRIVLFPADCWRDLYPFPVTVEGMSWAFSQVIQSHPDFAAFPRLRRAMARRVQLVLDEGEVLFIPACCAHEISGERMRSDGRPTDHVLSMNRFWRTNAESVRPHLPADALHAYDARIPAAM